MGRIKEIEARLSAIKAEIDNPESNIDELTKETDALIEERQTLINKAEQRKALLKSIENGEGTVINVLEEEQIMPEKNICS